MGEHTVDSVSNQEIRAAYIQHLLDDITALEIMLKDDLIEKGITRIGSEQEFCLVTDHWRPSNRSGEILAAIDDDHFTTELARYNLEINLDPLELKGHCFSQMEKNLIAFLGKARRVAQKFDTKIILTGILPSISTSELEFEYMTPHPRYWELNKKMKELRGGDFELHVKGVDELSIVHDSVLFEACNTSFQTHLQIDPDDFIASYNWAQAISAPVLGISTNSPLLFGRELWSETRIALFQQSIDTRQYTNALRDQQARVSLSNDWAAGNVADLFKHNIAQYKTILTRDIEHNSLDELAKGNIPKLQALNLHNGTIYHWNRPCYGVGNGKAHVRLENRYLPSGPSTVDEMANFAFWAGLLCGRPSEFDDMSGAMDFRDVKANFYKAARNGKDSILHWMGDKCTVKDLVCKELLPLAYSGLEKMAVDRADIEHYLSIIEKRANGMTGSQWKIKNYRHFKKIMKEDDAQLALCKSIHMQQQENLPVAEWPMIEGNPLIQDTAHKVRHIMTTKLFTVNENDLASMATSIMKWKGIHHVPVEDDSSNFCGLLTWTHMKRFMEREGKNDTSLVSDIMTEEVRFVTPEVEIEEAIRIMKTYEFGCLPVLKDHHLVGIITIADVIAFDRD